MPEIGETLREARMRRRIDMTEVETATKIRGKYLRALENEEWDLLPGPTFVKSFLRTYAEYLELDARLLVEEYRQRYERPSTQDLTPFSTGRGLGQPGRRRRARLAAMGPVLVTGLGAMALLAFFFLLGIWGEEDPETPAGPNQVREEPTPEPTVSNEGDDEDEPASRPPQRIRLRLEATGTVYVCVTDARDRQVVDEETLEAGERTEVFRSRLFRTNFGNDNVRMIIDGRRFAVEPSADPIGYVLRPGREPRRLTDEQRPDCSQ